MWRAMDPPSGAATRRGPLGDIAVVGGGAVGCAAAICAVDLDRSLRDRIVIIEATAAGGGAGADPGMVVLDAAELPAIDRAAGWSSRGLIDRAVIAGGSRAETVGMARPVTVVSRRALAERLACALEGKGVDVRRGLAVEGVRHQEGWIEVDFGQSSERFRAVVGADGGRQVLGTAFASPADVGMRSIEVITEDRMNQDADLRQTMICDFSAMTRGLQGFAWRCPCDIDGNPAIHWGLFDNRLYAGEPAADLHGLLEEFLAAHDYVLEHRAVIERARETFDPGGTWSADGRFVVGGGVGADPLFGAGIPRITAFGDLAGRILADAAARNDYSFASYRSSLLAHPVGRTLLARHKLALEVYRPGGEPERAVERIAQAMTAARR